MRKIVLFFFHLLFLLTPLFFLSSNDELFEFNKVLMTYAFTAMIAGVWCTRMILEKRWIWKKTPFDIPLAIFFMTQLLSTIFSINAHTSIFGYYSRFNGGLLSITSYIALYYAFVNNVTKKDAVSLLKTIFLSATLVSIYASLEHFGHSPSCLMITGQFDDACWVQAVQLRVFGTFGQPNWLAAYLIMLIPIAGTKLIEAFLQPKLWLRIAWALCIGLLFATLLFTQSRSGLLGLAVGAVVYVAFIVWGLWRQDQLAHERKNTEKVRLRPLILTAGIISTIFFLLILTFGTPVTPPLREMIEKISHKVTSPQGTASAVTPSAPSGTQLEVGGSESGVIRQIVWKGAIQVWKRYPIFGSGVETFAYSYYKDRPMEHNNVSEWDFLYNKAHNEFLNYLATTGTFGFGAYIVMICWMYVWAIRSAHKSPLEMAAWMAAYSALQISNFFGFSTVIVSTLFYLTPAFLYVATEKDPVVLLQKKSARSSSFRLEDLNIWQWTGSACVGILTTYLVIVVINMWRADQQFALGKQLYQLRQGDSALKALQNAIRISPFNEGVYHEQLALLSADLAISAFAQKDAPHAQEYGTLSLAETDLMMNQNPVNLNFYRSKTRVLLTLAQAVPQLTQEALKALEDAQQLSPTDPKLTYNRALVNDSLGKTDVAIALLKQALQMKPNYDGARDQLKRIASESGQKKAQ